MRGDSRSQLSHRTCPKKLKMPMNSVMRIMAMVMKKLKASHSSVVPSACVEGNTRSVNVPFWNV